MQNPNNPSKDSTTTPPSSPQQPPPSPFDHHDHVPKTTNNPTTEGSEGTILKTPMQVLEELSYGDDEVLGSGSGGDGGQSGGSVAVAVGGGSMVVEGSTIGASSEGQVLRKRKNTQLKDPPSGIPACPICKKEFATWKAVFGHMRKHPERTYRGLYSPPVFGASASKANQPPPPEGDGGDNSSKGGDHGGEMMNWERGVVASLVQGLVFDLNQQFEGGAGSSSGGAAAAHESQRNVEAPPAPAPAPESSSTAAHEDQEKMDVEDQGKNKFGFDLNELPSDRDDDEE